MLDSLANPGLRVLAVRGPERTAFLQGQLTQDVNLARWDATLPAGWCDPKGRLLWAGHLLALAAPEDPGLGLLVPAERAEELAALLRRFLFRTRARVDVEALSVRGTRDPGARPPVPGAQIFRCAGDPGRHFVITPAGPEPELPRAPGPAWTLADIRAGIPGLEAATSGAFVPQMVNLDLLGGISFSKGCYTGQEIVARTRYLGRVKRRMLRFAAAGPPPPPGSALHGGTGSGGTAGQVVRAAPAEEGCELLAVVVLDQLPGPLFLEPGQARPLQRLELPYPVPELAD